MSDADPVMTVDAAMSLVDDLYELYRAVPDELGSDDRLVVAFSELINALPAALAAFLPSDAERKVFALRLCDKVHGILQEALTKAEETPCDSNPKQ